VTTYNERPAEGVITHDLVPPVQLARIATEQRDQHGHRREDLQRIAAEIVVRPDEGVDHEEDQGDEDGHEKLVGTAAVEKDDPACERGLVFRSALQFRLTAIK